MKKVPIAILLLLSSILVFYSLYSKNRKAGWSSSEILEKDHYYSQAIQPIFNAKCIACHSCYNSPCQLNMTSYFSTVRGANKISIYDFPKLESREPTRMFIDGEDEKTWREKGFYSVLSKGKDSLLTYMITNPHGIESGKQNKYISEESRVCMSSLEESEEFTSKNPAGRMPYGFPGLEKSEIETLIKWQSSGAPGPVLLEQERKLSQLSGIDSEVKKWEKFFNRQSMKEKIASRYIYEHLFLAHIYFPSYPKVNFRLVRSKSESGKIKEIGTLYPFDDPKGEFSYRLRPVVETIVHKSHIPFEFNDKKMEKWEKSFFKSSWINTPKKMPAYGREGANPYKTFESIPAAARYQFFLDESSYHIMTFIKGPVCRGQTALNVINDHFWVFFIDPSKDALVNSKEFYSHAAKKMVMPAQLKDDFKPLKDLRKNYWKTLNKKYDYLNSQLLSDEWFWTGNKEDDDASITVSRHFDSAHVMKGLQGEVPKTAWVLDYHVFESIYYNLTAGYNVFGPILHQVNSRLFMEISRIASEDLFISFLKPELRTHIRSDWNIAVPKRDESMLKWLADTITQDASEEMKYTYVYHGTEVKVENEDSKESLLRRLKNKILTKEQILAGKKEKSEDLVALAGIKSKGLQYLPDTIIFSVDDDVYTLVHNKDHFNVSMLFFEQDRRNVKKDSIDIIPGIVTSYANAFMRLKKDDVQAFTKDLKAAESEKKIWELMKKYIISRSDKNFWSHYKYFSEKSYEKNTNEYGYLDLNRYLNI